ncbi:MAG TPA: glycosyltransferase family 1 protein [Bryobacteraceae bacterium]|nr:glycosyltransferase family 1 protein [Bryobacteraceae bacterium]
MATVAIDVRHVADFGYGTYIRNLIRAMSELEREMQFVLISKPGGAPELGTLPDNFRFVDYHREDTARRENFAFPWFVRNLRMDLVHLPLNRVPVFMPRPYIVTIHDMSSLMFDHGQKTVDRLHLWRFRRGLLRAHRVIAVSGATRRDVLNLMNLPADHVRQIYNAIDPGFLSIETEEAKRQEVRDRYQINFPYILYAGSVNPRKNVARIVEALALLRQDLAGHSRYKDLRLVIIGDQMSKYPALRRAVHQSRVNDAVRFLGFVKHEELKVFYQGAEAFVFPSLYEGFGLPPLEAMAQGTPVVCSGVSALPEVVGDAAMLVKPENVFDIARGVREVLLDDRLRAELVARGHEQVKRFSWYDTARQVLETYRDVMKRG